MPNKPKTDKNTKKKTATATIPPTLTWDRIRSIVWAFADLVRDKSKGEAQDYAKVVVPTVTLKRGLDIQAEWVEQHGAAEFEALELGVPVHQVLQSINRKSYRLYSEDAMADVDKAAVVMLRWKDLLSFQDNPNRDVVAIALPYGIVYKTQARTFVELMCEVIGSLNADLSFVFNEFEFKTKLLDKPILDYSHFYATCHEQLAEMSFSLSNVPFDMLGDMYTDLLYRFAKEAGKNAGQFFTPTHLVKNSLRFLDINSYAKKLVSGEKTLVSIGDPTAGSNTFLIYAFDLLRKACETLKPGAVPKEAFRLYGQELKVFQYSLGIINLMFHDAGDHNTSNCHRGDTISDYNSKIGQMRGKLDIVIANPPYGVDDYGYGYAKAQQTLEPRWSHGVPNKSEGEFAFLMTIADLLNKEGKAVVVMPLGTLFRSTGAAFRKALLDEDSVEGIVALPSNMFPTTSIPVALWILNRNKADADKGNVFFVNATLDFEKVGKCNEWQPDKSVEAYLTRVSIEDYSGYVSVATIEKNKFNMSVQRYFGEQDDIEHIDLGVLHEEIEGLQQRIQAGQANIGDFIAQALALAVPVEEV